MEWNNRCNFVLYSLILYRGFSTFHALIAAWASLYLLLFSDLFDEDSSNDLIVNRSSTISNMFLGFSIGYFLSDLAMVFWHFPALGGLEYRVMIGRVILFGGVFPIVELCLKAKMAFPHNLKNFKSESHTQCLCFFRNKALPEASQTPSKWFILLISYLCQVLHHGLSMFSISLSLMSSQGQIYILMVLFSESTTPFVNIRWYLDVAGRKSSTIYIYNGIALFFGWLVLMHIPQILDLSYCRIVNFLHSVLHVGPLTLKIGMRNIGRKHFAYINERLAHCTSGAGVDECGMVLEDREGID
ncbi:hypothetical protein Goklo_013001 [Gossypium klotzschianum]|uniref:TLC domain-containing protein n=1 Tax=Gossypium klotzschianum TaxID=34286 RepID=A0A7J8U381_9ROSI|nr:hypothetical protein [Gossypium klotzschianum]